MRPMTDYVADRAKAIDASGIRKVFDLAASLPDPINLSIGLPDFDVPEPIKQKAVEAIAQGHNRYTQTQGIKPLIEKVRERLTAELGRDPGGVLITSGVSGALTLAIMGVVNPGDECVFLDPYFVSYKQLLALVGGVPRPVDSYPDFRFDPAKVEAAITPRTKALVVNSPANPTGKVMSDAEVRAAVDLAKKHDLLLFSDEIYDTFVYADAATGDKPKSPAAYYEKTIIMRGFSKSHAMTGWRVGYLAGPQPLIDEMAKLQQYTFVCAPAPVQHAATVAMDVDMSAHVADYQKKRDLAFGILSKKFEVQKSGGAFYLFPKVPDGMTGTQFATKAIENNVLVIPGGVSSDRDTHIRVSYATSDEKLAKGCEILCGLV